ncbi:hypothetical protein DVQ33_10765 [Yersinia enterocolitica]|nr:hypothetical protein [Yersinia enterocolitica]EKN6112922.1 hypothetical protein [Yersinia enterocolitica]EKN6297947.1 hypothetical protein [Yersinia enterocolitica]EKN6344524.1 hypothetical protein [Yersinia enterocolitica]
MASGKTAGHVNGRPCVLSFMAGASTQTRLWKPVGRCQGCRSMAIAKPVRDEQTANLEQRDLQSGDAMIYFVYYPFV